MSTNLLLLVISLDDRLAMRHKSNQIIHSKYEAGFLINQIRTLIIWFSLYAIILFYAFVLLMQRGRKWIQDFNKVPLFFFFL